MIKSTQHVCSERERRLRGLNPKPSMADLVDILKAKKKCIGCLRILPLIKFNKKCRHYYQGRCHSCFYKMHGGVSKKHAEHQRKWYRRNALKVRAHQMVGQAIRTGLIKRRTTCSKCFTNKGKIHAHHDDYSKPLSIRWLCTSCHALFHSTQRFKQ